MPAHARIILRGQGVGLFPGYLLWIPSIRRLYPRGTEQLY